MREKWLEGEKFLRAADIRLAPLLDRFGPCDLTPVAPENYFSTLVRGILSQQVAPEVAAGFFRAFTQIYGDMPDPAKLAAVPEKELSGCGFSEQKAGYIRELSAAIVGGKIDVARFGEMDDAIIIKQLTEVKGFGRWTAEIFLILALNRADVLPAEDFGLKKAMKEFLRLPVVPQKRSQVTAIAEAWQPWRSLATWYFWQYFASL